MHVGEPFGGIIPGARGAVLRVLLREPAALTGRAVHMNTDGEHSLTAVQRALKTLVELEVVTTLPAGRAILYSLNTGHALVPPLRQLDDAANVEPRVAVSHYPQLRAICWQLGPDATLTEREALSRYEREWRHVDRDALTDEEQAFIDHLARRYSGGRLLV